MSTTDRFRSAFVLATVLVLGACAHKESYDLRTYVIETAKDRNEGLSIEAMNSFEIARPLLEENCTDSTAASSMTASEAAQLAFVMSYAISEVTGKPVTRIILVRPEEANGVAGRVLDGSLNTGCERCRIGTSFVKALTDQNESTIMNALGQSGMSKLQYRVNAKLSGACEPGVRETAFYYLAYATYLPYDPSRSYGFEVLVQHMSYAVPLGEKIDEPGAWYVKVR